jgi:hypothetical protein
MFHLSAAGENRRDEELTLPRQRSYLDLSFVSFFRNRDNLAPIPTAGWWTGSIHFCASYKSRRISLPQLMLSFDKISAGRRRSPRSFFIQICMLLRCRRWRTLHPTSVRAIPIVSVETVIRFGRQNKLEGKVRVDEKKLRSAVWRHARIWFSYSNPNNMANNRS